MRNVLPASSWTLSSICIALIASLALLGCGGGVAGLAPATPAAAPRATLTVSPSTFSIGQTLTLAWTTTNAASGTIDNGVGSVTPIAGGSTTVTALSESTTFTLTVTGINGGTAQASTSAVANGPTVTITAYPARIAQGSSATLTVAATNATQVVISNNADGSTFTLAATGGTQRVTPTAATTYTATASRQSLVATASTTIAMTDPGTANPIKHVIFLQQENRTFDTYFGMLNPYRRAQGWNVGDDGVTYEVDGIDNKLSRFSNVNDEGVSFGLFKFATTCIDDETSSWLESYGDVNRWDFSTTRQILLDGFVHTAENYAKSGGGSGSYTDLSGRRAMGYYDETNLNYYYYMASQFALSDRWFSPVASKSVPNRIATFTGGTTQGLVRDPGVDDHLGQLGIATIFTKLELAGVTWKIYYTTTDDACLASNSPVGCSTGTPNKFPATIYTYFSESRAFLYENPTGAPCTGSTVGSSTVSDPANSFCIDVNHIAPLYQFFTDMNAGTLPSFAFIEAGYGHNDEHPGSGQSILAGQAQMANILNTFMKSPSWPDSVFFLSYDEGGGPFDHVPPVSGHSNDYTDAGMGAIPDISSIAVNADSYIPCLPSGGAATIHCDLKPTDPGASAAAAPSVHGFAAQLGFRLPNIVVSPFTRKHYVSHAPMDHTAVIKFVESRFIGPSAHLTNRDAAQPDLLDFFDFTNTPWLNPPAPANIPVPRDVGSTCTPQTM